MVVRNDVSSLEGTKNFFLPLESSDHKDKTSYFALMLKTELTSLKVPKVKFTLKVCKLEPSTETREPKIFLQ